MQSLPGSAALQVSDEGLLVESASYESLAGRLAGNNPPTVMGSLTLASAAAVNACHAQVAAAGVRCSSRVQATAAKLKAQATAYTDTEASSVARIQAIATSTVS
jgi:hypothetical protein